VRVSPSQWWIRTFVSTNKDLSAITHGLQILLHALSDARYHSGRSFGIIALLLGPLRRALTSSPARVNGLRLAHHRGCWSGSAFGLHGSLRCFGHAPKIGQASIFMPTTLPIASFASCTFFTSCTLTLNVPPFSYTLNRFGCACTARSTAWNVSPAKKGCF